MLQFLYPAGLLAAIGIIVPVVIHLWNIKRGKTLKIGSISLLGTASNQRSSHLKIADWPLLLLRCLLLFLLAALLAKPVYKLSKGTAGEPGWILLEKQELAQVWKNNKKEIDSLLKKGYEIRDLDTGFQQLELKDTAVKFSRPALPPLSYFSLIRQLNAEKTAGASVYLYTSNLLNRFEGTQPYTHLVLKWRTFPAENGLSSTADPGRVSASPAGIRAADTAKLQVLIFSNGLAMDAAYLKAAVGAIADFTKRKITVREIRSIAEIKAANLVFWLSEKPLSAVQLKQLPAGISFFNYVGLKIEKLQSVIHYEHGSATQETGLYQRKRINEASGEAVWSDGFGTPLLTLDSSSGFKHYEFYSRFNQAWTDLVWSNGLVDALMPLVIPHQEAESGFNEDSHSLRTVRAVPEPVPVKGAKTRSEFYTQQSLSKIMWWFLIAVFFIERWITYKKTRIRI